MQEELQNFLTNFFEFEVFKSSFKPNDFQVLLFGDLNFPDVNWDAHKKNTEFNPLLLCKKK